ncbi:unnamed protein product [Arabidopsis lyrata]|nr:unnamed protein product [Arabidopsis lyrata]
MLDSVTNNSNVEDSGEEKECLAIGWHFDGLNDGNIQALRERLGAEMFEEVPLTGDVALTNPLPRRAEFKIPYLNDHSE